MLKYDEYSSPVPIFTLNNISTNGTNVLSKPANLIPMEQSEKAVTFGSGFYSEHKEIVTAFTKQFGEDVKWNCTYGKGAKCKVASMKCGDLLKSLADN